MRSTTDVMLLVLTVTVCATILLSTVAVAIIEIVDPGADTSDATAALGGLTLTILGAVLGLLAGRR